MAGTGKRRRRGGQSRGRRGTDGTYWLFGDHAVAAALANPRRRILDLVIAEGRPVPAAISEPVGAADPRPAPRQIPRDDLARLLPLGAVHQGIACRVALLDPPALEAVIADADEDALAMVLDQVTDPHNVGAILRSAAAFGAIAVIVPRHHTAPESGVMAKAASGALDKVPLLPVANLGRALERLARARFWCLGLAGDGARSLAAAKPDRRAALIVGAEGSGLRRLTRDYCDEIVRLPTRAAASLNVSAAAAVALYELTRDRPAKFPTAKDRSAAG